MGQAYCWSRLPELAQVSLAEVERVAGELGFRSLRREMVPAAFNANLRCLPGSKTLTQALNLANPRDAYGAQASGSPAMPGRRTAPCYAHVRVLSCAPQRSAGSHLCSGAFVNKTP